MNELELLEQNRRKRAEAGESIPAYPGPHSKPKRKMVASRAKVKMAIKEFMEKEGGPILAEAIGQALRENLNPEKLDAMLRESARAELLRIKSKVNK